MEAIKTHLKFGLKVLLAITILNLLLKTLLGVSVAMFIEDPIGTLKAKLGGAA